MASSIGDHPEPEELVKKHEWPAEGEHLWGPWMNKRGLPKPTQYRMCVHPECHDAQERKAPQA